MTTVLENQQRAGRFGRESRDEVLCGKYFPILTRCQTKAGERLVLAIMVRPCPKAK